MEVTVVPTSWGWSELVECAGCGVSALELWAVGCDLRPLPWASPTSCIPYFWSRFSYHWHSCWWWWWGVLPLSSTSAVTKILHVRALTLSCVQLFVTLWTVAHHVPLPMELSRQKCCMYTDLSLRWTISIQQKIWLLSVLYLDILYGLPTIKSSLSIGWGLLPGLSQKLKSADTQIS